MEPVTLSDGVVELAPPTPADVDAVTTLCQDPDIRRWTTVPSPYTRPDAEYFVGTMVGDGWEQGRECTWGIRTDGALVGMIGLSLRPPGSAEVGYWLGPQARGRGLLHRSLRLALGHAFAPDGLDLDRVEWRCFAGNWASWRAAWRVGFTFEATLRGGGVQRGRRVDEWAGTLLREDPREPRRPWPATSIPAPLPPTLPPTLPRTTPTPVAGPSA
ncbi:GNAT family N-acetyltransferase [uncultured Cellulomonas sp.]|uniref:GNAT family N-acetyltransferase n=1 Tax=uncultured Cellulomonas sp. TaxID=189682 RepID=UPI00262146AC|nr:GNAT family N-acetyltransferase [uncultured Cellulomonas sp.]